jgi:hypothetical protein
MNQDLHTHCPHCRKLLSIPELVEQYCETCATPMPKKIEREAA